MYFKLRFACDFRPKLLDEFSLKTATTALDFSGLHTVFGLINSHNILLPSHKLTIPIMTLYFLAENMFNTIQ